ncbi:hypothetical protein DL768_009088 [Monosporascus sp. mg162]|nr:hypothetical protein DL768_009088 [Monosporascus sp. mg162]
MDITSSKVSKISSNAPPITHSSGRGSQILEEAGAWYTDTVHVKEGMNDVLAQYDAADIGNAANPPPFAPLVLRFGDAPSRRDGGSYEDQKEVALPRYLGYFERVLQGEGIDGVKSAFPKFMAADEKSCAYEREFKLYQVGKGRPGTKEYVASDRRQKHATALTDIVESLMLLNSAGSGTSDFLWDKSDHGAAMRKAAFVFAAAWQSRQAVLAVPMATDIISSYPVSPVETHDKHWASYMKANGYPSNEDVCRMIRNKETDLFSRSGAEDYYRIWMSDNVFIMVDDWVQQLYLNATADAGITAGTLDCTALDSQSCWPPQEGACERYNPAGFHIIHTEIVRLLGPAREAGLVKELAATEEQRVGTIGSFQLNTVTYCLNQAASNRRGGYLDISKIADELPTEISSFFDDANNNIAALTAKLFGGASSQTLMHIDLTEFVNSILPATDGRERLDNEAFAPWYLLQQNYQDWEESTDTIRSYVHDSFEYMKIGLIGRLFKLRGLYVMNFAWLERDRCENEFEGASRYVDNGCFVLKVGGGGWKHLNHDDNAPTELNLAEEKYNLNLPNFFRNVRDCNNDERMMEHDKYGMGETTLSTMTDRYVYPYLETGHIRLLHILSVAPDIRVRIEVVSLNKSPSLPEYAALSYLWGDDKPFGHVIIEPESQAVEITRNLSICLSHLGDFVGTKIWIDALCINQRDNEEKSRQVSHMGSVYELAAKVLVWLGPSAEGSDAAMDGIIRFGRAAVDAGLLDLANHHLKTWPDVGDDPVHAGERFPRVAFARLTHRDYFNRVWVQQEITLARQAVVMCGHKCADAESFQAAITFYAWLVLWEVSEYRAGRQTQIPGIFDDEILRAAAGGPLTLIQTPSANPAAGSFLTSRNKYLRLGTKPPLLRLLHTLYVGWGTGGLQCGDSRDKVYGLLGMAADIAELGIAPDYSKTPEEVFEQVARSFIKTGHLDILKLCRSRRVQPPTWVPDFSKKIDNTWSDAVGGPLFKATGSRKQPTESHSSICRPTKPMSISLRGIRLDTVTAVGEAFSHDENGSFDQTAAQKMFTEIEAFLQGPSIYPATSWIDASWRIPICDRECHPTSTSIRRATVEYSRPQYITLRTQPLSGDAIAQTFSYRRTMKYRDGARPICSAKGSGFLKGAYLRALAPASWSKKAARRIAEE